MTVSQTSLVYDDHLDSFEEFWLCTLQNVPRMNLSDIFLMTRLGLWGLERKITVAEYHFHHIISSVHATNYHC